MDGQNIKDGESLRLIYGEICKQHHGIADFRAKLLALLPIASGTGLFFVLVSEKIPPTSHIMTGLVAALLVLGLYLYELRGIQRCVALCQYAREIEACLLGRFKEHGPFAAEFQKTFMLANNTNAALIIYPTQIAAWLLVANIGIGELYPGSIFSASFSFLIPLVIGLIFMTAGYFQSRVAFIAIEQHHSECKPLIVEKER